MRTRDTRRKRSTSERRRRAELNVEPETGQQPCSSANHTARPISSSERNNNLGPSEMPNTTENASKGLALRPAGDVVPLDDLDQLDQPATHAIFGRSEITIKAADEAHAGGAGAKGSLVPRTLTPTLQEKLTACVRSRPSLFRPWSEIAVGLTAAYALFLHLEAEPSGIDSVLRHPEFPTARRPQRRKTALIPVYLSAHPQSESEFNTCSAWSCVLTWARLEHISVADFPEWAKGVKLKESKRRVAARRRAAKANAPAQPPKPATLKVILTSESHRIPVSFQIPEAAIDVVADALREPEPVHVFTKLAHILAAAD